MNVEGDLDVGDSREKVSSFLSCETFKYHGPGGDEGNFPAAAQKFHFPFTYFPSNCILPLSLIPRSSHLQSTSEKFLSLIRNGSFVTLSHSAGAAPQGTAQPSSSPANFVSLSPPQRATSQHLWLPKGSVSTNQTSCTQRTQNLEWF